MAVNTEYVAKTEELIAAWREEKQQIFEKFATLERQLSEAVAQNNIPQSAMDAVNETILDIRATVEREVEEPELPVEEPEAPAASETPAVVGDTVAGGVEDPLSSDGLDTLGGAII